MDQNGLKLAPSDTVAFSKTNTELKFHSVAAFLTFKYSIYKSIAYYLSNV